LNVNIDEQTLKRLISESVDNIERQLSIIENGLSKWKTEMITISKESTLAIERSDSIVTRRPFRSAKLPH